MFLRSESKEKRNQEYNAVAKDKFEWSFCYEEGKELSRRGVCLSKAESQRRKQKRGAPLPILERFRHDASDRCRRL